MPGNGGGRPGGPTFVAASRTDAPAPWVDRPWIDLLIGCGGWSAPLLVVSYLLVGEEAWRWAAVFYALALVCNYPHYMATIHRAYGRREDRAQYRFFTHHVTALLLLAAVAAHVEPMLLAALFTAYVMWSPWHYTGQNFGLLMLFLRRGSVEVTPGERRMLRIAFVASYGMLLAAFNQGTSQDPLVWSLGLPVTASRILQAGAALVFVAAGLGTLIPLARRGGARALAAPLTLYSTQAFWFVVPILLTWAAAVPVPQTRYSTGILAVMHSAQYLWITRYYARRDAARRPEAVPWNGWTYWAGLIVGGIALFLPGPWLASYAGQADFTTSMLIVTAVVNLHHFVLDGVVWKLRNPRVAQALVESTGATMAPAAPAAAERRWRVAGRLARAAAAAGLVSLAFVDQWRYMLALRESDAAALATARALNPHDSGVHLRLASLARQSGDASGVEEALRAAIAANPHSLAAAHALERFLIESARWTEAYAQCRAILDRWPHELETLQNAGALARRLGDAAGEEAWWRRALARDPSLAPVHLHLAELLDQSGRAADALPHYQRHLELVVEQRERTLAPPRQVALVVLKFGDALARTGRRDLAAAQYDLAARIARQAGLADVEALARDRAATSGP